jgi:hypothetical protein
MSRRNGGGRVQAQAYHARLYAVEQTLKSHNWVDRKLAVDGATGIPFLYTKEQCDPGNIEYGMERYVPVLVQIVPDKSKPGDPE